MVRLAICVGLTWLRANNSRHGKSILYYGWLPFDSASARHYSGHHVPRDCPGSCHSRSLSSEIAILGSSDAHLAANHDSDSHHRCVYSRELRCWTEAITYEPTPWHWRCNLRARHRSGLWRSSDASTGKRKIPVTYAAESDAAPVVRSYDCSTGHHTGCTWLDAVWISSVPLCALYTLDNWSGATLLHPFMGSRKT